MKKISYLILVCIALSMSFCIDSSKRMATFEIDMTTLENNLKVNDFIDSLNYISLESTNNSIIGYITGLYVSQDRIYVMDYLKSKGVFIFNKDGKFLFNIQKIGNGPGEYIYLSDFWVNENSKEIIILANGNKLIFYDYNGNYTKTLQFSSELGGFYFLPFKKKFVIGNVASSEKKEFLYFADNQKANIIDNFLEIPEGIDKISRTSDIGYSKNKNGYLFTYPNSISIYEINENDVLEKYNFNVPQNEVLAKQKLDELKKMDEREATMKSLDYFSLESYFEIGDKLFFVCTINKKRNWGIYNIKNNSLKYCNEKKIIENSKIEFASPTFLNKLNDSTLVGVIDIQSILKNDSVKVFNETKVNVNSNPIVFIANMKNK